MMNNPTRTNMLETNYKVVRFEGLLKNQPMNPSLSGNWIEEQIRTSFSVCLT